MSQKRIPILRVKWEDSCSRGGWNTWEDYKRDALPAVAESVGYQVEKNADHITVAQSMDNSGKVNDTIAIPRKVVSSIEIIGYSIKPKRR